MKLRIVRANSWTVYAPETQGGTCDLLEFFGGLDGKLSPPGNRMLQLLERISHTGPTELSDEISHQLDGDIFEFIRGDVRVLWFYDAGKVVVCCHALVKKSQKIPRRAIRHARAIHDEYQAAKKTKKLEYRE